MIFYNIIIRLHSHYYVIKYQFLFNFYIFQNCIEAGKKEKKNFPREKSKRSKSIFKKKKKTIVLDAFG